MITRSLTVCDEDNDMYVLSSNSPHVQITKALKDEIDRKLNSPIVSDAKCYRFLIQSILDDEEEWNKGNFQKLFESRKSEILAAYGNNNLIIKIKI